MVRKILAFILLALSLFFISPVNEVIQAAEQRIYDEANLLSESEIERLEDQAATYFAEWDTDFIIMTTNDADGKDIIVYMQDFADELALQFNREEDNMAVLAIDMLTRDFYLAGFGMAETYLDNERLDHINQKITPDLSDGDYFAAFQLFFETANDYLHFRPGVDPESPLFNNFLQFGVAIVLGGLIVFTMAYRSGGRVTTTSGTYLNQEDTQVLQRHDRYLRKTVTKHKKPSSNNKSGGGFGGGGGISGGGRSHSGSRGSF